MIDIEQIGYKIKEIRKSKKISQEKLAEKVLMNTRSILRIENAQTIPNLDTLNKIAKALDVNITDFFETKIFKNKKEIIKDINKCLDLMSESELKKFHKAVYNYIH
ncbi:MAG: helix-turn-helix domain-containing protein [Candidatus Gastranaerophilales bacterium]|nr:helix-turn-helix domain-containing protein [Candidatus Gastranaerophilales bacterium]